LSADRSLAFIEKYGATGETSRRVDAAERECLAQDLPGSRSQIAVLDEVDLA
jgi:hypothetical protein